MIEKVKRYAEKWHMLEKEDKIIVGVSGGADRSCGALCATVGQANLGPALGMVAGRSRLSLVATNLRRGEKRTANGSCRVLFVL